MDIRPSGHRDGFAAWIEEDGDSLVVRACGELDLGTVWMLKGSLSEAFGRNGSRVVVDLTELAFIDLAGIAVLLGTASSGEDRKRLLIRGGSAEVRRTFELAGVDAVLPLAD